jgi:small subunit ribosomal protein S18
MARQQRESSGGRGGGRRRGLSDRGRPRKYARLSVETIDYKDLSLLRRFLSDRGKTRSRRVTGLSRKHQQQLALAVKRARELALLPYVGER